MDIRQFAPVLITLAVWAAPAAGVDLSKIDRTIAKEPTYQSKAPKYCLLVFGPEAKIRVWLVRDGAVLYVDRNGSGDLTEPGKAVTGERNQNSLTFPGAEISGVAGKNGHPMVWVTVTGQSVSMRLSLPEFKRGPVRVDSIPDGDLQFGDRPREAPIIHLQRQLTFALAVPEPIARQDKDDTITVVLGTPGLGRGTFAYVVYDDAMIPREAWPTAAIEFPNKIAGGKPIKTHVDFWRRR